MAAPLSQQELAAKVQQYEAFLNDRLKTDLTAAQTRKAKITLELKEYEDLERSLQEIKQAGCQPLTLYTDIGSEVLAQASVPDPSRVFLDIGLGFHVETDLDDAPRVIGIRKEVLLKEREEALDQVAKIRAHVRMVEETLASLQKL